MKIKQTDFYKELCKKNWEECQACPGGILPLDVLNLVNKYLNYEWEYEEVPYEFTFKDSKGLNKEEAIKEIKSNIKRYLQDTEYENFVLKRLNIIDEKVKSVGPFAMETEYVIHAILGNSVILEDNL